MTVSAFSITAVRRHLLSHGRRQGPSSSSSSRCFIRIQNTNGRHALARSLTTRWWDTALGSDNTNNNNSFIFNGAEEEEEEEKKKALPGSGATTTTITTTTSLLSNQQLVQQRLAVQRGKAEARERTIQARVDKNYRLKRLIHSDTASSFSSSSLATKDTTTTTTENLKKNVRQTASTINDSDDSKNQNMYAVKVWVEPNFRQELKLSGREKRGRVFLEAGSLGVSTLSGLRQELHGFFAALRKDTYLVRASLPRLASDGSWQSPEAATAEEENGGTDHEESSSSSSSSWPIETDDHVLQTFQAADTFFQEVTAASVLASSSSSYTTTAAGLKRPSIQISILKNPNAPPPPPPPLYLQDMPDPNASPTMTMLSFYAFPPNGIADPDAFGMDLSKKWKPFRAVGRVYVAQEGINAQMSVPTNVLPNFMECCRSVPELAKYMENGINIDSKPLPMVEFATAGVPVNGQPAPPFRNLHIRVRNQVLADGLWNDADALSSVPSLDWQSAGYDMSPLEWHQKLKKAKELKEKRMATAEIGSGSNSSVPKEDYLPIILDCRNKYESDVGIFEGAEPLDTDSFRDSWPVLKKRLADAPKDTPIMTYCTGGT
jgi:predicted sulfurtransferase